MRKGILVLSLVVLVGWLTSAWADIAPRPRPQPPAPAPGPGYGGWYVRPMHSSTRIVVLPALPQNPPIAPDPSVKTPAKAVEPVEDLEPGTRVQMANAAVAIQLGKGEAKADRPGRKPVLAKLNCSFELKRLDAGSKPDKYTMSLPVGEQNLIDTRGIKCTDFTVTIDGQAPKWLKKEQIHIGGTWYYGYSWPATIDQGATQKVTVRYALDIPVRNGAAQLTYALRSGALWDGPIVHETVQIDSEPGITMKAKPVQSMAPYEQAERKIVWDLRNLEPQDDIHVDLSVAE